MTMILSHGYVTYTGGGDGCMCVADRQVMQAKQAFLSICTEEAPHRTVKTSLTNLFYPTPPLAYPQFPPYIHTYNSHTHTYTHLGYSRIRLE